MLRLGCIRLYKKSHGDNTKGIWAVRPAININLSTVTFAISRYDESSARDSGCCPSQNKGTECAIDTGRELPVFAASNRTFPGV